MLRVLGGFGGFIGVIPVDMGAVVAGDPRPRGDDRGSGFSSRSAGSGRPEPGVLVVVLGKGVMGAEHPSYACYARLLWGFENIAPIFIATDHLVRRPIVLRHYLSSLLC